MDLKDTLSMLIGLWGDTGILGIVSLDLSGGYLFVFVCAILGRTLFVFVLQGIWFDGLEGDLWLYGLQLATLDGSLTIFVGLKTESLSFVHFQSISNLSSVIQSP